jgi:Activator of Hsp90 ATPase homolog 1-like protein
MDALTKSTARGLSWKIATFSGVADHRLSSAVKHAMRCAALVVIVGLFPAMVSAQDVTNTLFVTPTGEKVLRIVSTIPVDKHEAWKWFTTAEGLKKWIAPVAAINFRVGGHILTNYDRTKTVRDRGTIRLPIINYLNEEMITLKVKLNDKFPAKAQREDGNLQEIIQLEDLGNGRTRITSSMIGWGVGPEWDKTYAFFVSGNTWTYQQLVANFQH